MPNGKPQITEDKIKEIQRMRAEGFSYEYIAEVLSVSKSTAQKYAPGGVAVQRRERSDHKASQERFTERQMQIALIALENAKTRENLPISHWVK